MSCTAITVSPVVLCPPLATVSTSSPVLLFHAPDVPNAPLLVMIPRFRLSPVALPVSPVSVTLDPASRSRFNARVIVNMFVADATLLLCPITTLVEGEKAYKGFQPSSCPRIVTGSPPMATGAICTKPRCGSDTATPTFT